MTSPPPLPYPRSFRLAVALIGLLTAAHLLYYLPRTVDDMFIFLRYAEHLASGLGPVYNPGEPVEGHSSPLWTALLALGELLGLGGVSWAKTLGAAALAALQLGLYRLGREHLQLDPWPALLPPAFTALNSYLLAWSTWGLETPLYLALLLWSAITLARVAREPSRARALAAGIVCGAAALARPEAPLLVAATAVGVALSPLRRDAVALHLRRLLAPGAVAAALFGAHLLFRRAFYGRWLPHTYDAKQGSGGFDLEPLASLWGQGASPGELLMALGALLLAFGLAATRRSLLPLAVLAALLCFVSRVLLDWMPSQRHLLPLWLFAPLLWAAALQAAAQLAAQPSRPRLTRALAAAAAVACGAVLLAAALPLAAVDARYSPFDHRTHGGGVRWSKPKDLLTARDTLDALRHIPPAHVQRMGPFHHGMITQLYRLLEADDQPLHTRWYVGRDIGRVGWLAPARIFDTDGLFTPAVVNDPAWKATRAISPDLIHAAFNRPVAMSELPEPWARALQTSPDLASRYAPTDGRWTWARPRDAAPPDLTTLRDRYRYAQSRLPQRYYLMTLYGEAVGAALDKRAALIERAASAPNTPPPPHLPGAGVTLDAIIRLHGCEAPTHAPPGATFSVTCTFEPTATPTRAYTVFVHLEGPPGRLLADHPPAFGLLPSTRWRPGHLIRDTFDVHIPPHTPPGPLRLYLGLFQGSWRASAAPAHLTDGKGRVLGPVVEIR